MIIDAPASPRRAAARRRPARLWAALLALAALLNALAGASPPARA